MPRGDRTGPAGFGPMTGRAAGYCAGYAFPGYLNPIQGKASGGYSSPTAYRALPCIPASTLPFGAYPRFGLGRGWGRGRGRYWGRGRGFGPGFGYR